MNTRDLLLEIGCEELPSKQLQPLSKALAANIKIQLEKNQLSFADIRYFATPRRLAILVKDLITAQPSQMVEKRGPALKAAFDAQGHPSLACLGFATSCNTTVDQLVVHETEKGAWVFFSQKQPGAKTAELLPDLIRLALNQLPLAKPMRWGNLLTEFIRPVHWVTLLFGKNRIRTEIFNLPTVRHTFGHRFHHPDAIPLTNASEYEDILREQGYVLADFATRRKVIHKQIEKIAAAKGQVLLDEALLDEVTGLVEWPVALLGEFSEQYLEVPPETIMTAMKSHQKYFPMTAADGQLLPYFVIVSNIKSTHPSTVIAGNQRVIRARLADAQFFYHSDLKHTLESRLVALKKIVFQKKLGTLFDKAQRIAQFTKFLAEKNGNATKQAERAGLLCKTDLATTMVGEFAELQGIMGYYYALKDGEPAAVALALREHYQPRFAGDAVPETVLGSLLAIADKMDSLVGLFAINQPPSGEKDPFALRRAALGILRILIEKQLPLDLKEIIEKSVSLYGDCVENSEACQQAFDFIIERLRAWYLDKGIDTNVFTAVLALKLTQPLDFHHRVLAIQTFQTLPEAKSLIAANKRVSHLLKDETAGLQHQPINPNLLQHATERALLTAIEEKSRLVEPLYRKADYNQILTILASLQAPVDQFFNDVMVMVDDVALRNNRLALLQQLRQLFLQVANIALLQG